MRKNSPFIGGIGTATTQTTTKSEADFAGGLGTLLARVAHVGPTILHCRSTKH